MAQPKLTENKFASPAGWVRSGHFAFGALLIGALCISVAPVLVRLSELPPSATAFYRMLLALPVFAVLMAVRKPPDRESLRSLSRKQWTWLTMSGLLFAADLSVWHWSIYFTTVANATLLGNLAPIFVTVTAWLFLKEKISWIFILGMLMALAGASVLLQTSIGFGPGRLFGDFLGIVTAVFYAGYLISIKRLRYSIHTLDLMGTSTFFTTIALFGITWISGEALWPQTTAGWIPLLGLALISQVGGQGLIAYALAHLPVSFSSVSLLIQPVAAAILAWIVLSEALSSWQALGGLAVLIGIAVSRRGTLDQ